MACAARRLRLRLAKSSRRSRRTTERTTHLPTEGAAPPSPKRGATHCRSSVCSVAEHRGIGSPGVQHPRRRCAQDRGLPTTASPRELRHSREKATQHRRCLVRDSGAAPHQPILATKGACTDCWSGRPPRAQRGQAVARRGVRPRANRRRQTGDNKPGGDTCRHLSHGLTGRHRARRTPARRTFPWNWQRLHDLRRSRDRLACWPRHPRLHRTTS